MPASADSEMPIAHDSAAIRSGRPPYSWSSSGLSTEARIAVPIRVRFSSR